MEQDAIYERIGLSLMHQENEVELRKVTKQEMKDHDVRVGENIIVFEIIHNGQPTDFIHVDLSNYQEVNEICLSNYDTDSISFIYRQIKKAVDVKDAVQKSGYPTTPFLHFDRGEWLRYLSHFRFLLTLLPKSTWTPDERFTDELEDLQKRAGYMEFEQITQAVEDVTDSLGRTKEELHTSTEELTQCIQMLNTEGMLEDHEELDSELEKLSTRASMVEEWEQEYEYKLDEAKRDVEKKKEELDEAMSHLTWTIENLDIL